MALRRWCARLGAVSYLIWGLLHLNAAFAVYQLAEPLPASMVRGRVLQDAWCLLGFALAAIAIAATLNWRNTLSGYWINLAVVSLADLGFIFFILWPGHIPLVPGLSGPVFWALGWGLTTAAKPWQGNPR